MIAAVRATFGEEGLDRLLAERTRLQLRAYRERSRAASDGSLESRVRVLAAIRREQGYMAECFTCADGSLLLRENHCPICVAAKSCQGLCREELGLFRAVLGTRTYVGRTDHISQALRAAPTDHSDRLSTGPQARVSVSECTEYGTYEEIVLV